MNADQMVQLIEDAGGSMPFEAWVEAVRAGGGRPDLVQRLKSAGRVHTTREAGQPSVIRVGAKPAPSPVE